METSEEMSPCKYSIVIKKKKKHCSQVSKMLALNVIQVHFHMRT